MRYVKEYRLMVGPRVEQYGESARADLLQRFQAIVNVADGPESSLIEIPGVQQFWIPINELGVWDYTSHYAFKKVLDSLVARGRRVYVCCHAGVKRSPVMTHLWLQSKGHKGLDPDVEGMVASETRLGHIPKGIPAFLKAMEQHPESECCAILHKCGLLDASLPPRYKWVRRLDEAKAFFRNPYRYLRPRSFSLGALLDRNRG